MSFISSSSAAPILVSCHKVVLVPRFLVVPSQSIVWEKQGIIEGCIHIFHLSATPGDLPTSSSTENMPCASCGVLGQMKILVGISQTECSLKQVGIHPLYKKDIINILLTMTTKYRWKDPTACYMKSKSRYAIHTAVKEVNWSFWELGCVNHIPWATRYAFSRYISSCQ